MKTIINFLNRLLNPFKSLFNFLKQSSFEEIIDNLEITDFNENKGYYILFWGIASFTIVFLIWASLASVDQVVRASGDVVPTSKVHTVQSPANGILEEIHVKMSDEVEKGQLLFLINHKVAKKRYELVKSTRDALKRKVKLVEDLVDRGSEAEMVLIEERLKLYEAEKLFQNAELELKFSKIVSPVKGKISSVNAKNIDQVFASGEEIATIVPYDDLLQIECFVNPKDIAYVVPGLKAKLAFTAYDMSIYGQFDGIVKKVAPSTTQDAPDSPPYYKTIIEIDKNQLNNEKKISLQSGMTVDVSIIGESRTVLSYVINPITKLSKTALRD